MAYQFGTKRLQGSSSKTPLQVLLEQEQANELKNTNNAYKTMRQTPFRDVFIDKDGKYKEYRTDNQGVQYVADLTEAMYNKALNDNTRYNEASVRAGLNPLETTGYQEEPEKQSITKKVGNIGKKFVKNIASGFSGKDKAPAEIKEVGDAGRDILQPTNSNAVAGTNMSVDKTVGGGAIKSQITDDKLSKPAIDPNNPTEIAYNKSLETKKPQTFAGTPETEKAYQDSFSQKGKPPPNMSDRDKANIADDSYRKKAFERDNKRREIQNIIDIKLKRKQNFWGRNMGFGKSKQTDAPRLALPSMADANQDAQTQLANARANARKEAMDRSFVASAKADNKKAQEAMQNYQDSIAKPSPNTASVLFNKPPAPPPELPPLDMVTRMITGSSPRIQSAGGQGKGKGIVKKSALKGARNKVLSQFAKDIRNQLSQIETGTITPRDYKKFGSFK
tara:strand:+ start:8345 stop:9688 length:1344 start_codon:yes stop_codon:yes gene_type:complete